MMMKKIVLILTLILALFTGQVFAIFCGNDSDIAYIESSSSSRSADSNYSLRQLIIIAAGNILESQSDISNFLSKAELSELNEADFTEMQAILNRAILKMEKAVGNCNQIILKAIVMPYAPDVQLELYQFNYSALQNQIGMTTDLFPKTTNYLKSGQVTDVYILLKSDMELLLEIMNEIKPVVNSNEIPDISLLWSINQKSHDLLNKGQYISEVFTNF